MSTEVWTPEIGEKVRIKGTGTIAKVVDNRHAEPFSGYERHVYVKTVKTLDSAYAFPVLLSKIEPAIEPREAWTPEVGEKVRVKASGYTGEVVSTVKGYAEMAIPATVYVKFPSSRQPIPIYITGLEPVKRRVVVVQDGRYTKVLEAPEDVAVEIIPWDRISQDIEAQDDAVDALAEAIGAGEVEKALEISKGLTAEPPDDGYDEDPRQVGYPS